MTLAARAALCALVLLPACQEQGTEFQYELQDSKETAMPASTPAAKPQSLLDFTLPSLEGKQTALSQYKGKVVLLVNTASECGYTPQYKGLEALSKELAPKGVVVLGFPSNDFGGQEPGTAAEIRSFCETNYGVTFPMFAKVQTKAGEGQSPLYAWLGAQTGSLPNWNFCKYLIGKDGQPIAFYPSKVAPDDAKLRADIEQALKG